MPSSQLPERFVSAKDLDYLRVFDHQEVSTDARQASGSVADVRYIRVWKKRQVPHHVQRYYAVVQEATADHQ